jgi:uncharacterized membrane protein
MSKPAPKRSIALLLGGRIAPPRFLIFLLVLGIGLAVLVPEFGRSRGALAAFDIAAALFLLLIAPLMASKPERMRHYARANDANRTTLLVISVVVTLVILLAVASELHSKASTVTVALVVTTLILAWLFTNTIYALHYTHLYYLDGGTGKDAGGIDFPSDTAPDYWDFLYFSFTLGMTFQTSDVQISSRSVRRVVLGQSMAAFVFNIGVLALTINVLGSS